MKKLILICISVLCFSVNAQDGIKIEYEYEDIQPDFLKAKKQPNTVVLNFQFLGLESNGKKSRFFEIRDLRWDNRLKQIQEENEPIAQMYVSSFFRGDYYTDLDKSIAYRVTELEGKKILVIDSSLSKIDWQLKRENKKILNFDTRLAVFEDESKNVEAWYTTALPYRIGPFNYHGLPGTILELKIQYKNNDPTIDFIQAKKVEFVENLEISIPKNLEIYSDQEFQKRRSEIRNKFLQLNGQGVDTSD
ncbi:MAG: GLPGLI family protein [Flavobacteriaceae bacterium]|nr:GLPGLI family protein [Flavobacteriaceae bacterium]